MASMDGQENGRVAEKKRNQCSVSLSQAEHKPWEPADAHRSSSVCMHIAQQFDSEVNFGAQMSEHRAQVPAGS